MSLFISVTQLLTNIFELLCTKYNQKWLLSTVVWRRVAANEPEERIASIFRVKSGNHGTYLETHMAFTSHDTLIEATNSYFIGLWFSFSL